MNTRLAISGLWANTLGLWGWMSWHFWSHWAAIAFWVLAGLFLIGMFRVAVMMVIAEEAPSLGTKLTK